MIEAKDCIVWTNSESKTVKVTGRETSRHHLRIQEPGIRSGRPIPNGKRWTTTSAPG
jgi:hypothetical protein